MLYLKLTKIVEIIKIYFVSTCQGIEHQKMTLLPKMRFNFHDRIKPSGF